MRGAVVRAYPSVCQQAVALFSQIPKDRDLGMFRTLVQMKVGRTNALAECDLLPWARVLLLHDQELVRDDGVQDVPEGGPTTAGDRSSPLTQRQSWPAAVEARTWGRPRIRVEPFPSR